MHFSFNKSFTAFAAILTLIISLSSVSLAENAVKVSSSYNLSGFVGTSHDTEKVSATYRMSGSMVSETSAAVIEGSTYRVTRGTVSYDSPADITLSVSSVNPAFAYNTGVVSISDISGSGFQNGASVKLALSGEDEIIASSVVVSSSTKISCSFDLTGKKTGAWDLIVTNSDGSSFTLPTAFTVKSWVTSGTMVNYPNPFDPTKGLTTIVFDLPENADTTLLIFNISAELIYKQDFSSGFNGGKAGNNSISWNGFSAFGEMAANGVYFTRIVDKAHGKILAKGKIAVLR